RRAPDAGAAVRSDAIGGLVGRAYVLLSRRRRRLQSARPRRGGERAGEHASASRDDRPRLGSAQRGQAALRRGGARVAVARAQPQSLARDCRGMSAILVAVTGPQAGEWLDALRAHAQGRELRVWPDAIGNPDDIAYACVWLAPHGLLAKFRNLKAIINLGAGVDHLLADPHLPAVPMARVAHPDLT